MKHFIVLLAFFLLITTTPAQTLYEESAELLWQRRLESAAMTYDVNILTKKGNEFWSVKSVGSLDIQYRAKSEPNKWIYTYSYISPDDYQYVHSATALFSTYKSPQGVHQEILQGNIYSGIFYGFYSFIYPPASAKNRESRYTVTEEVSDWFGGQLCTRCTLTLKPNISVAGSPSIIQIFISPTSKLPLGCQYEEEGVTKRIIYKNVTFPPRT